MSSLEQHFKTSFILIFSPFGALLVLLVHHSMDQLEKTIHVKSCSRRSFSSDQHQSPTSVLSNQNTRRKLHRTSSKRKSLTLPDLELEELKGFRDLGFEFSDKDREDPNLVSIVPGLRWGLSKKISAEEDVGLDQRRPYLSEAWEVMKMNEAVLESTTMMINRRLQEMDYNDQNAMKEQIKLWARSVASAVR